MKKTIRTAILIAFAPLLMAMQCDDDVDSTGFETSYLIQNDSGADLFLVSAGSGFTEIKSTASFPLGSDLNTTTVPIPPSASGTIGDIELFERVNGNYIRVYQQAPLDDELWEFREPSTNRYEYLFRITDDLLE